MPLALVLIALWSAAPAGGCSLRTLDEVASFGSAHGALDQAMASRAISEACAHALPKSLVQGLSHFPEVSPHTEAAQMVAAFIREDPSRWAVLCPAGPQAWSLGSAQADAKGGRYDACGWQTLALGSREEFQRATTPELGVVVFHALVHDAGLDASRARLFARAIGGLSAPAPKPPPAPTPPATAPTSAGQRSYGHGLGGIGGRSDPRAGHR